MGDYLAISCRRNLQNVPLLFISQHNPDPPLDCRCWLMIQTSVESGNVDFEWNGFSFCTPTKLVMVSFGNFKHPALPSKSSPMDDPSDFTPPCQVPKCQAMCQESCYHVIQQSAKSLIFDDPGQLQLQLSVFKTSSTLNPFTDIAYSRL